MRYDPENDPYQDLNDPAVLDNTPIGTLRVVPWAGAASVAVMDHGDPTIVRKIIYTLHVNENPLNAIYGKRPNEATAWRDAYEKRDEEQARRDESLAHSISTEMINACAKIERRYDDGREAIAAFAGAIPLEVKG